MKLKTALIALVLTAICLLSSCASAPVDTSGLIPFINQDFASVIEMIDNITVADLSTEKQIEEAFLAYCALDESVQAEVTNYEKLHSLRNEIAKIYNPDAESKQGGKLIDRSQILIGTYCVNSQAWTDELFQAMKDCNIDLVIAGAYNTEFLDLCEKYGIKTYVSYLRSWGVYSVEARGQVSANIPLGTYTAQAESFVDHPAIVGFDICDEPHSWDYSHLELLRQEAQKLFPDKLIYINLLPSGQTLGAYAAWWAAQEGYDKTYDYYDYISDYDRTIQTDFISYDLYCLAFEDREMGGLNYLDAAATLGDITRKSGKDYWYVPQVNSGFEDVWVTTQQLRYQVYNALPFGVKAINWACWTAGWWYNNVVDSEGNLTQQYDKLKIVNNELKTLSPIYMRYTNKDSVIATVYENCNNYKNISILPENIDNDLEQDTIKDISISEPSTVVIGYFEKNLGEGAAFMFSNASDFYCGEDYPSEYGVYYRDMDATVSFKKKDSNVELTAYYLDSAYKLTPDEDGVYTLIIPNGEGIFVTIEPVVETVTE